MTDYHNACIYLSEIPMVKFERDHLYHNMAPESTLHIHIPVQLTGQVVRAFAVNVTVDQTLAESGGECVCV